MLKVKMYKRCVPSVFSRAIGYKWTIDMRVIKSNKYENIYETFSIIGEIKGVWRNVKWTGRKR